MRFTLCTSRDTVPTAHGRYRCCRRNGNNRDGAHGEDAGNAVDDGRLHFSQTNIKKKKMKRPIMLSSAFVRRGHWSLSFSVDGLRRSNVRIPLGDRTSIPSFGICESRRFRTVVKLRLVRVLSKFRHNDGQTFHECFKYVLKYSKFDDGQTFDETFDLENRALHEFRFLMQLVLY